MMEVDVILFEVFVLLLLNNFLPLMVTCVCVFGVTEELSFKDFIFFRAVLGLYQN